MTGQGWINYVNVYHTAEAPLSTSCLTAVEIPADLPKYCVSWLEIPVTCHNIQCFFFFRRRCVLHQLIFLQVSFLLMIKEQTRIVHFASSSTESLLQEQQDWSQLNLDADTRPVSSHRVCVCARAQLYKQGRLSRSIVCKPGCRDVWRSDRKGE